MNIRFFKNTISMTVVASFMAVPAMAEADLSFLNVESGRGFETEYDKSFQNDPNAKPMKPETTAFFKGPFEWEVYAKQAIPQVVPSTFDSPMTNEQASDVGFITGDDRSALIDVIRLNNTSFQVPTHLRTVYIQEELPLNRRDILDDPSAIHSLKGYTTLIVQEDQRVSMNIASVISIGDERYKENVSCSYRFLVNGREIESRGGNTYRSRKPFPKGSYDLEFDLNCEGPEYSYKIHEVEFDFKDDQGRKLPNIDLPYVNRDQEYDGSNFKKPTLISKVLNDKGELVESETGQVDLGFVEVLSDADQSNGVFEETHAVRKLFKGEFVPQKEGVYQFAVVTGGNTCATFNPERTWRWLQFPGIRSSDNDETFCTDSRDASFYYLTSHPVAMITTSDGTVVAGTPQSDVVYKQIDGQIYGRPSRTIMGAIEVPEEQVGKPVELHIQAFSNFTENGQKTSAYDPAQGVLLADVRGNWGGLPAGKRNGIDGSKVTKSSNGQYKAHHFASFSLRAPGEKYFRPFSDTDFAKISEADKQAAEKANEISDDWLNASPDAKEQEKQQKKVRQKEEAQSEFTLQ